jgi:hypothetical protein
MGVGLGATAGHTGSRGTGEVRPRGRPCCHRLQSAETGHNRGPRRTTALDPVFGLSAGMVSVLSYCVGAGIGRILDIFQPVAVFTRS